jgi:hypothetical protein
MHVFEGSLTRHQISSHVFHALSRFLFLPFKFLSPNPRMPYIHISLHARVYHGNHLNVHAYARISSWHCHYQVQFC